MAALRLRPEDADRLIVSTVDPELSWFERTARTPTARWMASLAVGLVLTLLSSVTVALRATDRGLKGEPSRAVSYSALGAMEEIGFEIEQARTQSDGDIVSLPGTRRTPHPKPTSSRKPHGDEPVDPDPDDDDGDELGEPDPLKVTASVDRTTAAQNDAITYTFSIENISDVVVSRIVAEQHIPAGTYAAGSCSGLTDEGTLQPPVCADVPGLPASGSDDYHVLRAIGDLQPGQRVEWTLKVRVGSDTPDGAAVVEHCRARGNAVLVPSEEVVVLVI